MKTRHAGSAFSFTSTALLPHNHRVVEVTGYGIVRWTGTTMIRGEVHTVSEEVIAGVCAATPLNARPLIVGVNSGRRRYG